jgi:hypothetical protein
MPDPQNLPQARLVPKDGADRMAILRDQAATGARAAGRLVLLLAKVVAVILLVGAGLFAIGSATGSRSRERSWDRHTENMRRLNESLKTMRDMPRFDFGTIKPRPLKGELQADGASPSQAATSRQ